MKKRIICLLTLILGISLCGGRAFGADLILPIGGSVTVEFISADADFINTLSVVSPTVDIATRNCELAPAGGLPGLPILSGKTSQIGCKADLPDRVFKLAWEGLPEGRDVDFNDFIAVVRQSVARPKSANLLLHWAPVLYQDINKKECNGVCDYITSVDYDGDFNGLNNWDNALRFPHPGVAYASVSESDTHWFLYYAFYHARDWVANPPGDGEHEHDMEGAMVFVRKDGTAMGFFEGAITLAHGNFWPYRSPEATYIVRGEGAISADRGLRVIQTETLPGESHARPALYQEQAGHGVFGCGHRPCPKQRDDGIRYVPSLTNAQIPMTPVPSGTIVNASYKLIDMTAKGGIWDLRFCHTMFENPDRFNGDKSGGCGDGLLTTCEKDGSNPIWSQNDKEDNLPSSITLGSDPAATVNDWFSFVGGIGPASTTYINHAFCAGHDLCQEGNAAPASCGGCVARICAEDPFCCQSFWDSSCVQEVASICHSDSCSGQPCAHDVCAEGGTLSASCSHCAAQVCEVDPFCCNVSWDSLCVSEVHTVCQLRCEQPAECR